MGGLMILGGTVVVALSCITDASGTVRLVTTIIGVRGVTFVCQKIASAMNKDMGDILNITGWSIAGVSMVGLLINAKQGIKPTIDGVTWVLGGLDKFCNALNAAGNWMDKITPW